MLTNSHWLLIFLIRLSPLPISPDKISRNQNNIDRQTYRKKPRHGIIRLKLRSWYSLLGVGHSRTIRRSRICYAHGKVSLVRLSV